MKKKLIVAAFAAIAAFITAFSGFKIAPDAIQALCEKVSICTPAVEAPVAK